MSHFKKQLVLEKLTFSLASTTAVGSVDGPILQVPHWWCVCMVKCFTQQTQYSSEPKVKCLHPGSGRSTSFEPMFLNGSVSLILMANLIPVMRPTGKPLFNKIVTIKVKHYLFCKIAHDIIFARFSL